MTRGSRSVSTLPPDQLERKRAHDRKAQRAIRARTKKHIERVECERDEFRNLTQDLLCRNKALEDELNRLREYIGMSTTSSPYSAPAAYDEHVVHTSGATIPSPRMSPLAASAECNVPPDSGHHHADTWAVYVPSHTNPNVSSPFSSAYDYTNVSTTMMPTSNR